MTTYATDAPVLVTFFVRPDKFRQVFAAIRNARPPVLFLVADGPRNAADVPLNDECKKIAEGVDWECQVHRIYAPTNLGIDNNTYNGLKYAFGIVDRLIFFEDDILPNPSFFPFCTELLEKYKDDERIHMICGMNHMGEYSKPSADYFFSRGGSIWGFALWKRTFDKFEPTLEYLTDEYTVELLAQEIPQYYRSRLLTDARKYRETTLNTGKLVSIELLFGIAMYLYNSLMIVATKNLISNIGISENSGHAVDKTAKLPKVTSDLFYMKTYDFTFPLIHPKYVIPDRYYERMVYKNINSSLSRKIEGKIRRMLIK